jgi:hypothetical protein
MIVNVLETISSGVAWTWGSTFSIDLDLYVRLLHGIDVFLTITRGIALINNSGDESTAYRDVIIGCLSFGF